MELRRLSTSPRYAGNVIAELGIVVALEGCLDLCGSPLSHLVVAMSGFMTSAGGHSLWHSWDERRMTKRHVSAQRGPKYSLQDSAR